jgi:hypothetical protein
MVSSELGLLNATQLAIELLSLYSTPTNTRINKDWKGMAGAPGLLDESTDSESGKLCFDIT